jgi:DNA-binding transcriptional regulator LsrR (DeoR family)
VSPPAIQRLIIGVAGGVKKAEAILAALRGKLITGLITDEVVAQAILDKI